MNKAHLIYVERQALEMILVTMLSWTDAQSDFLLFSALQWNNFPLRMVFLR